MAIPFVPDDFQVPLELRTELFRLEPLGPQHNERDHGAWMASIDHIGSTPGYTGGRWPYAMSLEKNLIDLKRHAEDFSLREGFTYTVLDGDEIVGAVYVYPTKKVGYDARVKSWVIAPRAELDKILWESVSTWLSEAWPFNCIDYERR